MDCVNPQTGEIVTGMIGSRRQPLLAPSSELMAAGAADATPADILGLLRRSVTRNAASENREAALAMAIPPPDASLELGEIGRRVLDSIRSGGRATVRRLGTFSTRRCGQRLAIDFKPGKELLVRVQHVS